MIDSSTAEKPEELHNFRFGFRIDWQIYTPFIPLSPPSIPSLALSPNNLIIVLLFPYNSANPAIAAPTNPATAALAAPVTIGIAAPFKLLDEATAAAEVELEALADAEETAEEREEAGWIISKESIRRGEIGGGRTY